jgi:hypothetical protein
MRALPNAATGDGTEGRGEIRRQLKAMDYGPSGSPPRF